MALSRNVSPDRPQVIDLSTESKAKHTDGPAWALWRPVVVEMSSDPVGEHIDRPSMGPQQPPAGKGCRYVDHDALGPSTRRRASAMRST